MGCFQKELSPLNALIHVYPRKMVTQFPRDTVIVVCLALVVLKIQDGSVNRLG